MWPSGRECMYALSVNWKCSCKCAKEGLSGSTEDDNQSSAGGQAIRGHEPINMSQLSRAHPNFTRWQRNGHYLISIQSKFIYLPFICPLLSHPHFPISRPAHFLYELWKHFKDLWYPENFILVVSFDQLCFNHFIFFVFLWVKMVEIGGKNPSLSKSYG